MMKQVLSWILWVLVLVSVNVGAFPIAAFSLFGTSEGTSIFSIDYFVAFAIMLMANIVTIQLFLSLRKNDQKGVLLGGIFAIMEVVALLLFITTDASSIYIPLAIVSILGATILLIRVIKK
ncbi:hypothetical protein [Kurthia massiliensis]|uniref:hypothetical protein n=1 Tax=Kurthia massiliensis TaxID=1033739 RepID=UPI0002DFB63B|nr:hypothetical protein [Kurthia massiliensis]